MGQGQPPPRRQRGQRMLTQAEVEADIKALSDAMEDQTDRLADLAVKHATATHAYGMAKSKATLTASSAPGSGKDGGTTVDERKAMVARDCEQEWLASLIAEAHYETSKEILRTQRTQVDALRTIAANIRAQT